MSNLTTYETLLSRNLERIGSGVDIKEGSFLYDAIASCVMELYEAYLQMEELEKRLFADTAYEEYLDKRCAEREIYRKKASPAMRKGFFNTEVPIGSRWGKEELTYIVTKQMQNDVYLLQCKQNGAIGNQYDGNLINIDAVEGITDAKLGEIVIPGENEETDDALRYRYFSSFEKEAFGGNIKDYQEKIGSIEGVGQVKVYPAWNGGGTVKVRLLDTENNLPSEELIALVQTKVDPLTDTGKGLGLAPIGHSVTIEAPAEVGIAISTHLTLKESSWEHLEPQVRQVIENYLNELRAKWSETDCIVRVSQIEARLLEIEGVIDVEETTLNGNKRNLYLTSEQVPILLEVTNT